jgi:hypothetical protein
VHVWTVTPSMTRWLCRRTVGPRGHTGTGRFCRIRLYRIEAPPAAARTWLCPSSDSPVCPGGHEDVAAAVQERECTGAGVILGAHLAHRRGSRPRRGAGFNGAVSIHDRPRTPLTPMPRRVWRPGREERLGVITTVIKA